MLFRSREVAQPNPSDTRAYLEQLTKAVFIAGLNWKVVKNQWPGFLEAFHGTFHDFLASHPNPEATVQDLKERFHHLGKSSARAFLWRVGEPTREWRH